MIAVAVVRTVLLLCAVASGAYCTVSAFVVMLRRGRRVIVRVLSVIEVRLLLVLHRRLDVRHMASSVSLSVGGDTPRGTTQRAIGHAADAAQRPRSTVASASGLGVGGSFRMLIR